MKTISTDTHPEAERFHIELIRKASIFERLQIVASLIKTTRKLSWQGICERYPDESTEARRYRFFCLLYGDEALAKQVTDYLILRNKESGKTAKSKPKK